MVLKEKTDRHSWLSTCLISQIMGESFSHRYLNHVRTIDYGKFPGLYLVCSNTRVGCSRYCPFPAPGPGPAESRYDLLIGYLRYCKWRHAVPGALHRSAAEGRRVVARGKRNPDDSDDIVSVHASYGRIAARALAEPSFYAQAGRSWISARHNSDHKSGCLGKSNC